MTPNPIYSQRDPQWAGLHYGLPQAAKTSTIGAEGCGITAIAQKLTILGTPTTPIDVQNMLYRGRGYFTYGYFNFINWACVAYLYPQFIWDGLEWFIGKPVSDTVMGEIHAHILSGDPVIVFVDASKYERGLQQHFVLCTEIAASGEIVIANPWNGRDQTLRPYDPIGDPTDKGAICGVKWLDKAT